MQVNTFHTVRSRRQASFYVQPKRLGKADKLLLLYIIVVVHSCGNRCIAWRLAASAQTIRSPGARNRQRPDLLAQCVGTWHNAHTHSNVQIITILTVVIARLQCVASRAIEKCVVPGLIEQHYTLHRHWFEFPANQTLSQQFHLTPKYRYASTLKKMSTNSDRKVVASPIIVRWPALIYKWSNKPNTHADETMRFPHKISICRCVVAIDALYNFGRCVRCSTDPSRYLHICV